jgi:hypothetical protein
MMVEIGLFVAAPAALLVTLALSVVLLPSGNGLARDLGLAEGELPSTRGHGLELGSTPLAAPISSPYDHASRL